MSTWRCQRLTKRQPCGQVNDGRKRNCQKCGRPRPKRREPAHRAALRLPYERFLEANRGIERCGICDAPPTPTRKLQRDHEHRGDGLVRGLLCARCNWRLGGWMTPEWLEAAAAYLRRGNVERGEDDATRAGQ